jgi:hypothetical protein
MCQDLLFINAFALFDAGISEITGILEPSFYRILTLSITDPD